jgi:transposase InsO family protein
VPHANASLTERGRLKLARLVVEEGWPLRRAAERFQCSPGTAKRWADRYRAEGAAGMADRSSRPHRSPNATRPPRLRKIKHLRVKRKLGPVQIAARVGCAPSTVHKVLVREGLNRLSHVDRATGEPVRRYERNRPGELLHVDIKRLGAIPPGGGWRVHGRGHAERRHSLNRRIAKTRGTGRAGYGYVHAAVDDHSRLAYAEIHDDETAATAVGFLRRAVAFFTAAGVTVERVLTDNGPCYLSRDWRAVTNELAIKAKRTRRYRPQTNGKVERFNRTLLAEWAYAKPYRSESARRAALPKWIHIYNHHRPHTALGGRPPTSRVPNLCGQNI